MSTTKTLYKIGVPRYTYKPYYRYAVSKDKAKSLVAHAIAQELTKTRRLYVTPSSVWHTYDFFVSVHSSLPIESAPAQPDTIRAKLSQAVQLNLFD